MTTMGWFIMLTSITAVMGLLTFCLYRIFSLPKAESAEHIQTQPFIDTHDTTDAD
jgi:hypothetical protein